MPPNGDIHAGEYQVGVAIQCDREKNVEAVVQKERCVGWGGRDELVQQALQDPVAVHLAEFVLVALVAK